ncbi:MAG: amidohydrolase family protein [Fibrella sp.]|nr:amidohydrolase family protein [Armatimonadota bacterium]
MTTQKKPQMNFSTNTLACHVKVVLGYAMMFLLCLAILSRADARIDSNKTIAISNVTVIDVKLGRALPDQTVILSGNRIKSLGSSSKVKAPSGAIMIHGKGLFLMPGLFDSHVHLNNPERETKMLVANGIVFIRDMGGDTEERIAERKQAREGKFLGLEMICVGTILDGDPPYHSWSKKCATPEEGRAAVREMKAAGVDQIKVYSLLKPEVHRAICAEAKKQRIKVVGHVPDSMTLEQAISAGQQGVEHLSRFNSLLSSFLPSFQAISGDFDGGIWTQYPTVDKIKLRERLRTLAKAGAAQCPTLVLHAGQARILDEGTKSLWGLYALPDDRMGWDQIPPQYAAYGRSLASSFPYLQQTVVELQQSGIPLLIGTDLGNPGILAGFAVHKEMQLWQDAGLRPAEILRAATLTPAQFFGVASRLGTIEQGKTASLLLIRKNPLDDIRNAAQIEAVFARGNYFDKAALNRLLTEAQQDVRARSPDPSQKVTIDIPGQVIAEGNYDLFYEKYGDGRDEFRITRDSSCYRLMVVRRQQGFGRYHVVQTGEWNLDFTPRQVISRPVVLLPTIEKYNLEKNRLNGTATRDTQAINTTSSKFSRDSVIRSPISITDYFLFRRFQMKVGETRRVETFLLGRSDWKPARQSVRLTRYPDESIEVTPGQRLSCQHYQMRSGNNLVVKTETWLNAEGLPVKQTTDEGGAQRSAVLSSTRLVQNKRD